MLVGEKSAQQIHVKQEFVFFSLLGKKCHITSLLKFIIMIHTHTKEKNKAIKKMIAMFAQISKAQGLTFDQRTF